VDLENRSMSTEAYAFVLSDLRAKHAALGDLILALENVSRLSRPTVKALPAEVLPDERQRPERRAVKRPTPDRRKVVDSDPVTRGGAGKWDGAVLEAVGRHPHGIGLTDVGREVGASSGQMFSVLKRLVRDRAITKAEGLYRLAGKPAKEAL
jgi:hypothetical protein